MAKNNSMKAIFPFFILLIIDAIGFGIIAPILAPLVDNASNLLAGYSDFQRHIIFGLILAAFPLSYMLGSPLLGALSDHIGRKSVLRICLWGSLIGFLFYALSFSFENMFFLILGRIIAGVTSGSQGVAQAAVADMTSGKERAISISMIAIALTIGLVAGPLLGGVLSDPHLCAWFTLSTPFYIAFALTLGNLILLQYGVNESLKKKDQAFSLSVFFTATKNLWKNKKIRQAFFIFFLFELGWSLYYQSLALLLAENYHASPSMIAFYSAYIGIILSLGLFFLVKFAIRFYSLKVIIQFALAMGAVSLFTLFFQKSFLAHALLALPVTAAVALTYSCIITYASQLLSSEQQGLLMGNSDSLLALAFAITGFLSGWLAFYNVYLPYIIAGCFMSLGFLLSLAYLGNSHEH